MNQLNGRKKHVYESPSRQSLRRTLSNRTTSNIPGSTTPQHHGQKLGKENSEYSNRSSSTTTAMSQEGETFKTPTRTIRAASSLKGHNTPECYSKVEMCASTPGRLSRPSYTDDLDNDGFSVTVAVRVRPFNRREDADSDVTKVVAMSGNETTVTSARGTGVNSFCFDHCFWSFDHKSTTFATQQMVYEKVGQPLLYSALEGYHTCLFAYGQTGSGKSYTMMGDSEAKGVIPRFCEELFSKIMEPEEENVSYKVEVSFFEIYNEKIHDLLCDTTEKDHKKMTLRVREHPSLGPYVEGLSVYQVKTFSDISRWIRAGNSRRATAATGMNDASSRSHSVFMIVLTRSKSERFEDGEHINSMVSKINLIDLAGSERSSTAQTSGDRLKEGSNINKSLMTLGKVISNLSEKSLNPKKKVFIPYRESVLTWLLKESLGGNSKTAMIATISPASTHVEETMSTLRYAKQAESIINIPKVNEDPNARLVRELRAEIERLRLISKGSYNKQLDLSVIMNCQPNLINIDENPQNEEVLVYLLKSGKNRIGEEANKNEAHDKNQYCVVENANKLYCVKPGNAFQTLVNGREVRRQTFLNHGDRLIVGNSYFRFNHPEEVRKKRKRKATASSGDLGGIKHARNEIIEDQKKRMEDEVEKLRKQMDVEMDRKIKSVKESSHREANQQNQESQKRIECLTSQVSNYQEQVIQLQDQKRGIEVRSSSLLQEKAKLLQQFQNVKNLLQTTLLPVIGVATRPSLYHGHKSKILQELETEKDKMTYIVKNLSQKRRHRPCTDYPVAKKHRNDVDGGAPLSAVQTACLRHLKYDRKLELESPNILDEILLELGRIFTKVHKLKSEKDFTESLDSSFLELTCRYDVLLSLLTVFSNMLAIEGHSLLPAVKDASSKLKQELLQFLQSLQIGSQEGIVQNYTRIIQTAAFMCKLTGEMNARTGISIKVFRQDENESCHWSLKQAVITGGDTAVDRELQSGLQDMIDLTTNLREAKTRQEDQDLRAVLDCAAQITKSFAILLNKCQETQFELGSVLALEDESRENSFYLQSYERTLSIISNVLQGLQEVKTISKQILAGMNASNSRLVVLESTKLLYTSLSTIGFSASTSNLLPSHLSASSLESTSTSSSSSQSYKPSELAFLASRQAMGACQALQKTITGDQGSEDEDEVFMDDQDFDRHVRFQDPTSKDVILVTKYSHNQNELETIID